MKAIAIQQPWAQLVAAGYKRVIHTSSIPFNEGERIFIYASDYDPLAKNDGEGLPPEARMLLENAKILGYLTDDELPTGVLLGMAEIVGWNHDKNPWEQVDKDKDGADEYIMLHDARAYYTPIKYENINRSRVFDVSIDDYKNHFSTFKFEKICRKGDVLRLPCSSRFDADLSRVEEYTYALYELYNNNHLLWSDEEEGPKPIPTSYIEFYSNGLGRYFKVEDILIEPSNIDKASRQVVYKIRPADYRDLDLLPQPLRAAAIAAYEEGSEPRIYASDFDDYEVSNEVNPYVNTTILPKYILLMNPNIGSVEMQFSIAIPDGVTDEDVQKVIYNKTEPLYVPHISASHGVLSIYGYAFFEDDYLSPKIAARVFALLSQQIKVFANALIEISVGKSGGAVGLSCGASSLRSRP